MPFYGAIPMRRMGTSDGVSTAVLGRLGYKVRGCVVVYSAS